ncbi:hypothetical protein [Adhaeretor mobilis]|uniref:Motility protein n=1 Tax=Adhaeretor mobilis TaxID=1930276 RepID=A0A517N2E3_9BACT|nr:hypothetical protein [Adhaeretor mobilis]QDT01306.1 hypothetical protein HG15A2_46480 [Adhaeretor mobilis]
MNSIDPAVGAVLAAKQASQQQTIGYTLLAKSLQATEAQGQAALDLLDSAAALGKAHGKGSHFDSQA